MTDKRDKTATPSAEAMAAAKKQLGWDLDAKVPAEILETGGAFYANDSHGKDIAYDVYGGSVKLKTIDPPYLDQLRKMMSYQAFYTLAGILEEDPEAEYSGFWWEGPRIFWPNKDDDTDTINAYAPYLMWLMYVKPGKPADGPNGDSLVSTDGPG